MKTRLVRRHRATRPLIAVLVAFLALTAAPVAVMATPASGATAHARAHLVIQEVGKSQAVDGSYGLVIAYLDGASGFLRLERKQPSGWATVVRVRSKESRLAYFYFRLRPGRNDLRVVAPRTRSHPLLATRTVRIDGWVPPETTNEEIALVRERALADYNVERADAGLPALAMDDQLNAVAQAAIVRAAESDLAGEPYSAYLAEIEQAYEEFPDPYWAGGYCTANLHVLSPNDRAATKTSWVTLDDKIDAESFSHVAIGVYRPQGSSRWYGVTYVLLSD